MSEYQPGIVAVATVRGVPNVRVFRLPEGDWAHAAEVPGSDTNMFNDISEAEQVTDVRPLVVLDPADEHVAGFLRSAGASVYYTHDVVRQIEAQTKPPRIPEPGLWGVVEATWEAGDGKGLRCHWIHNHYGWVSEVHDLTKKWDDLDRPTLVREGVQS